MIGAFRRVAGGLHTEHLGPHLYQSLRTMSGSKFFSAYSTRIDNQVVLL